MIFNKSAKFLVYGDTSYRGECPKEDAELITFFNELRKLHPQLSAIAIHPDNEGIVIGTGHQHHIRKKSKGAVKKGASDIIIIGNPTFVCELKRRDHTKSHWEDGQAEFLENCAARGAFSCVALGYEAAFAALNDYLSRYK